MGIQITAAVVFVIILTAFLWFERKKVKLQKMLFPVFYMVLYHTKVGIRLMDRLAKRHPRIIRFIGYCGIWVGFLGLIFISWLIIKNFIDVLTVDNTLPGVQFVLPVPVKGTFYVPFFYYIIAITIIAVVHEFAHGVLARAWNLRVKTTGIGFLCVLLPVVPLAFVEPDEKQIRKAKLKKQLSVYAAGPFANILLGFILLLLAIVAVAPLASSMFVADGITVIGFQDKEQGVYPAKDAGMVIGDRIIALDGVETLSFEELSRQMQEKKAGEDITVTTNSTSYTLVLGPNPQDAEKGYLGVLLRPSHAMKEGLKERYGLLLSWFFWFMGLFEILILFNLAIGAINLFPIFITDGARMLLALIEHRIRNKQVGMRVYAVINGFFLFVLLSLLIFIPLSRSLFSLFGA